MATTIDEALEFLADTGPEFGSGPVQGLSNHGPMAAEAMLVLGRGENVLAWLERYRLRLEEHPPAREAIGDATWREALGEPTRVGDWIAFFDRLLREQTWAQALDVWAPRLAPGMIAGGTHGVIRTAHAVRSLAETETAPRLHELAEGLGYWAARYRSLPEAPAARGSLRPAQAVSGIPPMPPAARAGQPVVPNFQTGGLYEVPGFDTVIELVDMSGDDSRFLSDLTETSASVFLANAGGGEVIGLIHALTAPSGVRLMLPHVSPASRTALRRYAWQVTAALYSVMAPVPPAQWEYEPPAASADDLTDGALRTGDEHAMKFTEACLREHALNPAPVYLAAAAEATRCLGRGL